MGNDLFFFCPKYMVPRTKPPQAGSTMSLNGWPFTSKPKVPFVRMFTVKLQGMYWYLNSNDTYDETRDRYYNARLLEIFYEEHGTWKPFDFPHPHLGIIRCRFAQPVEVPEATPNSNGLIEGFDIQLTEHNPRFR